MGELRTAQSANKLFLADRLHTRAVILQRTKNRHSGGTLRSVGTGRTLRRVAFNLLRFRQDRDPLAPADFSSLLLDLKGACDGDCA
jgi:hypothetical protein